MSAQTLQHRGSLQTVRSVLVGLVSMGVLGIVGALLSYRADVAEARGQVAEQVKQQSAQSAAALALHFELLRSELQRQAERPAERVRAPDVDFLSLLRDDRNLFAGGVGFVEPSGRVLWADPPGALPESGLSARPWLRQVLATGKPAVDELFDDDSSRIAVALPVHDGPGLAGVLVGVVKTSDKLLYGLEGPGEGMLLLSGRGRVLLPLDEPGWSHRSDFSQHLEALRAGPREWPLGDDVLVAHSERVRDTALGVLAFKTEAAALAPIRRRLNWQLVFLLALQLVAVGAFTLFLRRTWRAFLEVEARATAQEKMAALGAASSLIAHEVKNSLNGLQAAVSLLEVGGDEGLATRTMQGQVERLGHLARSLLSFARPDATRLTEVDAAALVREVVRALEVLPEMAEATVRVDVVEPLRLASDPALLTAAVDNLVRNAVEAAVAARDVGLSPGAGVTVRATREAGDVVISVEDEAGGPPEGFEARLGEPFATSKPRGIGLGLTMTLRAAEQLGGALRFTRTARGSRFELRLPVR